jgi:spermidine synthase
VNQDYGLGSVRTRFAQERQGLIPLLLHPAPRAALFLGIGTGCSAGAAAGFGGASVDAVEILPEVVAMLPWFRDVNRDLAGRAATHRGVRVLVADARRFVLSTNRRYDVVVGDLFVPWRAGEGALYAREHFEAIRGVLAPGGLFCQWLPLYQLDPRELRVIVRTFLEVFPRASATRAIRFPDAASRMRARRRA